jgi:hypothetical protein
MEKEAVRRTSKLLFGSKHRLEIAAAVAAAPDDRIYGRAIATSTGVADNQVWSELRRMEDADLLVRLPKADNQPQVLFRRVPSAFWDLAWEMVGEFAPPATIIRRLEEGETGSFDVRGSLLAPLQPWIRDGRLLVEDRDYPRRAVLRGIVGLLNSGGGTLLIGAVEDRYLTAPDAMHRLREYPRVGPYVVVGLLDPTFTKYGWDKWEHRFRNLVAHDIDPSPGVLVGCRLLEIHGRPVCSVTVAAPRYDEAYFLRTESKQSSYYVREGPHVVALQGSEMVRHWKDLQHRQQEQPSKRSPEAVAESP